MSLIKTTKQIKEELRSKRDENIRAHKVGAAINSALGFQQIRGCWPLGNLDENYSAYDITGQGRVLSATDVSSGLYNSKIPYAEYNGVSSEHYRASEPGLEFAADFTLVAWFSVDVVPNQFFIAKDDTYAIYVDGNGNPAVRITDSGFTQQNVSIPSITIEAGKWYMLAGRHLANNSLSVFCNGVWGSTTGLVDLLVEGSDFRLGHATIAGGEYFVTGKIALAFVAAAAASDQQIMQHYSAFKSAYKVYD